MRGTIEGDQIDYTGDVAAYTATIETIRELSNVIDEDTSTPYSLTLIVSSKNIIPSRNVSQQASTTKNTGATAAFLVCRPSP